MQPRTKGRAPRGLGRWRDHARPAGRATYGKAPVLRHDRRYLRQLDPLRDADDLGAQVPRQAATAARARRGTMLDHCVGIGAQHPAVTLVAGLGAAGLGLLPLLLAVGRGRLGRGARGLLWPLQPQHQLDQLLAAQPFQFASTPPTKESAKFDPRKSRPAQEASLARQERSRGRSTDDQSTPWVITIIGLSVNDPQRPPSEP
jgi:hypothetical protein